MLEHSTPLARLTPCSAGEQRHAQSVLLSAALCFAGWAVPSHAQLQPVGSEVIVNTVIDGRQLNPALDVLSTGSAAVVWEGEDGGDREIFGRLMSPSGQGAGDEFSISTHTGDDQIHVDVAALDTGEFLVVWENADSSISSRRFDSSGAPSAEVDVAPMQLDVGPGVPRVVPAAAGRFVVAWESYDYGAGRSSLRGRFIDSSGSVDGNGFDFEAAADSDTFFFLHGLAALPDDGFLLAWKYRSGGVDELRVQKFAADGTAAPSFTTVTTSNASDPILTSLDDGGFMAVWSENPNDGLLRRRYADDGTANDPVDLSPDPVSQNEPDAIGLPGARAAVVWRQTDNGEPLQILLQIVAADDSVEARVVVDESQQTLSRPRVAYDSDRNEIIVIWSRRGTDLEDIYLRRYSFDALFVDGFESGDTSAWSS